MARFEYISRNKLELKNGLRHATLGEVPEQVVYGVQGKLKEHYGVPEERPADDGHARPHCRRGRRLNVRHTRAGDVRAQGRVRPQQLQSRCPGYDRGRRQPDDPDHEDPRRVPDPRHSEEQRAAADRAVKFHAPGCPAHESVKDAIDITWEADYGDN